jgi:hypothetical protein
MAASLRKTKEGLAREYSFHVSDGDAFAETEEFPDDDSACRQALLTVRDIEAALGPIGGEWSIEVRRENNPIFQTDVRARHLGP